SRGELVTCHVRLKRAETADAVRAVLREAYADEPFIRVAEKGVIPATGHVRGPNFCVVNALDDRIPGRVIVIAAIDNLVNGSAGQALQTFNLACGFPDATAISALPLLP